MFLYAASPVGALFVLISFPWNPRLDFPESYNHVGVLAGSLLVYAISFHAAHTLRNHDELKLKAKYYTARSMAFPALLAVAMWAYLMFVDPGARYV